MDSSVSELERAYSVSAQWTGELESSTIKVTDSQSERTWEFGWSEVFPSDIPHGSYDKTFTMYLKFHATPEEVEERRLAINVAKSVLSTLNEEVGGYVVAPTEPGWATGVLKVARGTKTIEEMREME